MNVVATVKLRCQRSRIVLVGQYRSEIDHAVELGTVLDEVVDF